VLAAELAPPEDWLYALPAEAAVLTAAGTDALAADVDDVTGAAAADKEVDFDRTVTAGFNTTGLETLDAVALINITHFSP
jgi:hypothetical protein